MLTFIFHRFRVNVNKEIDLSIYEDYLEAKELMAVAKKTLEDSQVALYNHYTSDLNFDNGIINFEEPGFKIKITKGESIAIDQKLASVVGVGFRTKYELDKASYKKLDDADKKRVDECLTTKPKKPSFIVERAD